MYPTQWYLHIIEVKNGFRVSVIKARSEGAYVRGEFANIRNYKKPTVSS